MGAAAEDGPEPRPLALSPAPEPVPALRHRLFPTAAERTPGDAAPVYLRTLAELPDEFERQVGEKYEAWIDLPIDEFPIDEARTIGGGSMPELLAIAARREYCDWSYPLAEQREHAIEILLPDAQALRNRIRLLALKAKLEIAEGDLDEAIRTIETGLAMSVHLAEGPFLINDLVGRASADSLVDRIEELVARPDAPNLYWALTALPRPMIDFRDSLENEQAMAEWVVPEITGLDDLRTEDEWRVRLARLHERLRALEPLLAENDIDVEDRRVPAELDAFVAELTPQAERHFAPKDGAAPESEAERIVRFIVDRYRQVRDESYKLTYLPYADAARLYAVIAPETAEESKNILVPAAVPWALGEVILAVRGAHRSQALLERRIAALRVVEAIRMHVAEHGSLPSSLDAISAVPVPGDPISGGPFSYRIEGDSAILEAPEELTDARPAGLPYRITIRK
ncbi:hypothetical protein [Tautonia plasticadhaerens]|uniref:hypothetical protein n=1 Tax=Tautonia plasticadhaerens TaxID=2527974 RepID=UPI00119D5F27|nr:hypothetical protein [Tautonia plasticadhaerens]